jgi:hypothetical protein
MKLTFNQKVTRAYRTDPTRTATLRKRFKAELMGRFDLLARDIRETINTNDYFGLRNKQNKALTEDENADNEEKVSKFLIWLEAQIRLYIFGAKKNPAFKPKRGEWMDVYGKASYESGLKRGYTELKQTKRIDEDEPEPILTGRKQSSKKYLAALALLLLKTKEEIKGVTNAMTQQMGREIIDNITGGSSPEYVTKQVINRLDKIGRTRSKQVADDSIVKDHNWAKLDIWVVYGVTELALLAEWTTAGDDRVCELCAPHDGEIYPIEEFYSLLPVHSRCRCTSTLLTDIEI